MAGFRLNAGELEALDRDGFVLRKGVFSKEECGQITEAVEALVRDLVAAKRNEKHVVGSYMFEIQAEFASVVKWEPDHPEVVQGIEPFAHLSKPLNDWALDPRFIDPCKDLVGSEEITLFTEKLTMKRARTGGHIVLHQDFPYWEPMTPIAHRIVTALLYLDDATVENGCLEVVPGSHKEGLPQRKDIEGFGNREIDVEKYKVDRLRPVEANAGSVVYFGGFLVHRSLPNRSDKDRRALLYSYYPAGNPHGLELNRLLSAKRRDQVRAAV